MALRPTHLELRPLSQTSLLASHVYSAISFLEKRRSPWFGILFMALGLLVTSVFSILLLIADARHWTFVESSYNVIIQNRASISLIVQLLSNAFALIWVSMLCTLINYASRIYFNKHTVEMDTIRLWHSLFSRSMAWNLPIPLLLLLLLFIGITAIPSAIWAGALTPVITTVLMSGSIQLPAYQNTSNIVEWPSEINSEGPSLRSPLGFFTYSVGVNMQGSLLASASSASPVDGSVRQHEKIDYTRFSYYGRSYGVGASVGLMDASILHEPLSLNYSYVEPGFKTAVSCIQNKSSNYRLVTDGANLYAATGELPNSSPGDPEYSVYVGHGTSAIVAIGVGRNSLSPTRMLVMAAGKSYSHLDQMQCTLDYQPALFNISVDVGSRNISVTQLNDTKVAFNPHNLTHIVTRQFELIANDQTNLYVSLVGNSLNSSIADHITSQNGSITDDSLTLATPIGLANSFEAMVDDMLGAYASAQLMIANETSTTNVVITKAAVRVGETVYIHAVFGINVVMIVLMIVEATRTRLWHRMTDFDYMDPADLIIEARRSQGDRLSPRMAKHPNAGGLKVARLQRCLVCST